MRLILILLVLLPFDSHSTSKEELVVGNWKCDSFTIGEEDADIFDVTHTVEYRADGTSTDIHLYKLRGMEAQVWIKVAHTGPWKIQGDLLIEKAELTEILDAAIPELTKSEEMLQALSFEGETFISDIIELTKSKFVTKDHELDELGTCVKI
ncbi:hypothetical protein [Shewanella sedimentimangrovi]|uniref:Uncharacterized protein n=1 Tax=Shewanella sedimentimangrovi TaxID=2814293 RepID=A0ABX7R3L7_9GAMM|nr:hypothetical protein [Shewanella sedimentimangrovi]QSX38417.1 hypothetical protein JYB85_06240 [Shewanella sedimentimangrovi]